MVVHVCVHMLVVTVPLDYIVVSRPVSVLVVLTTVRALILRQVFVLGWVHIVAGTLMWIKGCSTSPCIFPVNLVSLIRSHPPGEISCI